MKHDSSGPAFPGEALVERAGYTTNERRPTPGMTVRDYFMAHVTEYEIKDAIAELGFLGLLNGYKSAAMRNAIARKYCVDAMLAARAQA